MPMPINNPDEYDKVINVSWYTPDKDREQQKYVYAFGIRENVTLIRVVSLVFFHFRRCTRFVASTFGTF
jgi:hypothetical protein